MTVDNDDNSSVSIDIDFEILNSGVVSSDVPMKPHQSRYWDYGGGVLEEEQ
jgi:hypothetical protein